MITAMISLSFIYKILQFLHPFLFSQTALKLNFSILARNSLCSLMICWLLLVPAGVPVLVSFSLFFLSSGKGFCSIMICWFLLVSAGFPCLSPFFSFLCFRCLSPFFSLLSFFRTGVLFHHDLLLVPAGVPVFVSLLLSSLVPVLVSLLLSSFYPQERGSVPSRFPGSSWFRLGSRCLFPFFPLPSFLRKGVLFHHGFPGSSAFWRVPVLVSLLLSFSPTA